MLCQNQQTFVPEKAVYPIVPTITIETLNIYVINI